MRSNYILKRTGSIIVAETVYTYACHIYTVGHVKSSVVGALLFPFSDFASSCT